jgi:two-component system, chemotaxis family, protein-glutamate methylesterase/glutaminase
MNHSTLMPSQIRVLIVDDSAFMRTALSRMIASDPGLDVVGTACSGSEALAKIPNLDPHVVTLDVEMPGMDGLRTLRSIMAEFPRPVIMVSAATEKDAEITFSALSSGAFDYVPKQLSSASLDILHIREELLAKIRAAAHAVRSPVMSGLARKPPQSTPLEMPCTDSNTPMIIALGTSTGGPKALQEILPVFPADFPVPILIVQHMPPGFTAPFAQRLNKTCAITVCEAQDRQQIRPGIAYIAPAGKHMTVERRSKSQAAILLDSKPAKCLHIPSVDVMMESIARGFGHHAIGVILTGMGCDGAEGMEAIFRHGGITIGQDQATCAVYGMPRSCAELGILTRVLPLADIPAQILELTRQRKRA